MIDPWRPEQNITEVDTHHWSDDLRGSTGIIAGILLLITFIFYCLGLIVTQ